MDSLDTHLPPPIVNIVKKLLSLDDLVENGVIQDTHLFDFIPHFEIHDDMFIVKQSLELEECFTYKWLEIRTEIPLYCIAENGGTKYLSFSTYHANMIDWHSVCVILRDMTVDYLYQRKKTKLQKKNPAVTDAEIEDKCESLRQVRQMKMWDDHTSVNMYLTYRTEYFLKGIRFYNDQATLIYNKLSCTAQFKIGLYRTKKGITSLRLYATRLDFK
jgi:hypothetical protein